jgi:hypothetical protein
VPVGALGAEAVEFEPGAGARELLVNGVVFFAVGVNPDELRRATLFEATISTCSSAAAPEPVCEAMVSPVSREAMAAASISLRSSS